jgi:hypothetical protein
MNKDKVLKNMNDLYRVKARLGKMLKKAMKDNDEKSVKQLSSLIKKSDETMKFFGKRYFEVA